MSSNTNIGNTPVNQGYVQLIHTGETGGIDGTLRTLYDGDGTASDLQIASNKVKVSTELFIGSDTLQEYIQDTVGAMLVTNASHTNLSAAYDDAGDGAIDLTASGEVTLTGTQTLSNKTLTAPTLTGTTQGASITLSGDLTVNGTTTTVNQTNLDVSDNIIGLNRGAGSNANDSGLIIERGSTGDNAAIIWDESADKFTLGTTTSTPSATGDLTISTGTLVANVEGNVSGNLTTDSVTISTIQTGSESFADNDTSLMTSAAIQDKIQSFGFTTNTGDMTGVSITASDPLDISQSNTTSGNYSATISLDASEFGSYLTDMTDLVVGDTDELAVLDNGTLKRKQIDEIRLTAFDATGFSSGISFDGSTANGVLTFKDSDEATVESNLTFDGSTLALTGDFNVGSGDLFVDDSEGRVGIGTTSPSGKLHVSGDAYFTGGDVGVNTTSPRLPLHVASTDGDDDPASASATGAFFVTNSAASYGLHMGVSSDGSGWIQSQSVTSANEYNLNLNPIGGSVGIGTSSPNMKLNISHGDQDGLRFNCTSTTGEAFIDFGDSGDNDAGSIRYDHNDNSMKFRVNASERARIDSSGNVGIGTDSPGALLTLYKDGTQASSVSTSYQLQTVSNSNGGIAIQAGASSKGLLVFGDNGNYDAGQIEYYNSSHDMAFSTNETEALRIDSSQNVGIGTTDPASYNNDGDDFVIYGTGNTGMSIVSGTSSDSSIMFADGTGGTAGYRGRVAYDHNGDYLRFDTAAAERVRIDSSGRLVVGATAPIANVAGTGHFQVLGTGGGDSTITIGRFSANSSPPTLAFTKSRNGTIGGNTIVQDGDNLGQIVFSASDGSDMVSNSAKIEVEVDGTPGSNDTPGRIGFYTTADGAAGSVEAVRIDSSQDAHFDQDVIAFSTTPSDIRLKENFEKIENGLDVVSKLEGHTFNWKKGGERLSAGFKAQEVEKVLPHLVDEKKLPLRADDDKEYKILRYEEMIPYLVEAIKQLKTEIEELRNG